jgi:hypothetical protein
MCQKSSSCNPASLSALALLLDACEVESIQGSGSSALAELQVAEDDYGYGEGESEGDGDVDIFGCGDGVVDGLELCDDGNQDNTDACTTNCKPAVCGDGYVWKGYEACDGNLNECSADCTTDECSWDMNAAPLPVSGVHTGVAEYGGLAFDQNCDLVFTGEHTQHLYRLSRVDGSVSVAAGPIVADSMNSLTAHPDGRIYVVVSTPNEMWALEPDDSLTKVADLPKIPFGMTVAPAGYGGFGNQLIWGTTDAVYATNPADGTSTKVHGFINGNGSIFSDVAFSPDGTLYTVINNTARIMTVAPGGPFALFADLSSQVDGLRVDPLGTQLIVASFHLAASLDSLSIPGAVKTEGPVVSLNGGGYPTGMVFDATGRLIYLTRVPWNGPVSIDSIIP